MPEISGRWLLGRKLAPEAKGRAKAQKGLQAQSVSLWEFVLGWKRTQGPGERMFLFSSSIIGRASESTEL